MRRWFIVLAATAGCSHARVALRPASLDGTLLTLSSETGDAAELARLERLALDALPRLEIWGGLRAPTQLVIVSDHAALEERVGRRGYAWLRAWARYDVIYLQSPGTWLPLGLSPPDSELREVLTHELSHCAMYQAAAGPSDWARKEIPLWFREGFASWTAAQAPRRLSRGELARRLDDGRALDPVRQAEALYQTEETLVYSAAHWSFDLLRREGQGKIGALLDAMRLGQAFPQAFLAIYGETEPAFEARALTVLRTKSAGRVTLLLGDLRAGR